MSVLDNALQSLFQMAHWETLWVNSSPASSFSAQSLEVNSSPYDLIVIQFGSGGAGNKNGLYTYEIGDSGMAYGSGAVCAEREVTVSAAQITFSAGYTTSASGWVVNNAYLKPLVIYGLKL